MTRLLQFINLAGVLALAVLCVAQWQSNRQFNMEISRLEAIRLDQARKLDARDTTISGQARDLESLREHLTRLTGELKDAEGKRALAEREAARLSMERDQLKESVTNWVAAVKARDERIRENQNQLQEIAGRLSETVLEYNELATNFNASVQMLDARTAAYNELVAKYNELTKR
jgi:chromosome segregation ATPase